MRRGIFTVFFSDGVVASVFRVRRSDLLHPLSNSLGVDAVGLPVQNFGRELLAFHEVPDPLVARTEALEFGLDIRGNLVRG